MRLLLLALALCGLFSLASTSQAQTSTPPALTPTPVLSTVIQVGDGYSVELIHRVDYGQVFIVAALLAVFGALVVFFLYITIERAFER